MKIFTPPAKRAQLRHNPWVPFTEPDWTEFGSAVDNPFMNEDMADYYNNLLRGFPYVCCELPTTPYGRIVAGRMDGDPHAWYCSKCRTVYINDAANKDAKKKHKGEMTGAEYALNQASKGHKVQYI
jgi:hypothetical protein